MRPAWVAAPAEQVRRADHWAAASVVLGSIGLVWWWVGPLSSLAFPSAWRPFIPMLWPAFTIGAIVAGFVGGHRLEAAGLPTRRAVIGLVLGFVGLPFSLVVAGYYFFINFISFPAA